MNKFLKLLTLSAVSFSLAACSSTGTRVPILDRLILEEIPDNFITKEHSFDEGKAKLTFFKNGEKAGGIYMDCSIKQNQKYFIYYHESVSSFFFIGNYKENHSGYPTYRISPLTGFNGGPRNVHDNDLESLRFVFKDENYLNKEIGFLKSSRQHMKDSCEEYIDKKESEEKRIRREVQIEKENIRIPNIETIDKITGDVTGIQRMYSQENTVYPSTIFKAIHENGVNSFKNKFVRLHLEFYYVYEMGVDYVILSTNPYGRDSAKNKPNVRLIGFTYDEEWIPPKMHFSSDYVYRGQNLVFKDHKEILFGKDELVFESFPISKKHLKKINSEFNKQKLK